MATKSPKRSPSSRAPAAAPDEVKGLGPLRARTRMIAILAADGVDVEAVAAIKVALEKAGAKAAVLAPRLGTLKGVGGKTLAVDNTIVTMPSVAFDGVFLPGGADSIRALSASGDAMHFVMEAYKHCKSIAAVGKGAALLDAVCEFAHGGAGAAPPAGIISRAGKGDAAAVVKEFIAALAKHRHWTRAGTDTMPA